MRQRYVGLAMIFGVAAMAIVAAFAVHASRSSLSPEEVNLGDVPVPVELEN